MIVRIVWVVVVVFVAGIISVAVAVVPVASAAASAIVNVIVFIAIIFSALRQFSFPQLVSETNINSFMTFLSCCFSCCFGVNKWTPKVITAIFVKFLKLKFGAQSLEFSRDCEETKPA